MFFLVTQCQCFQWLSVKGQKLSHMETEQQTQAHSTRGGPGSVGWAGPGCGSFYKSADDAGIHIRWKIMPHLMLHRLLPEKRPPRGFQIIPELQENSPEVADSVLGSCTFSLSHHIDL